ncbi:MAG: LacI family DNA-binding transcriptional regulator [Anaerolineae bacterium]|nr:LacI family DNA-binding transcriptional regulator [Anaerolineae bacterium]
MKSSSNVTIVDVAEEAGVSYTTVSRVLNNKESVKSETRERVLMAMTRLGYVVDQRARSLAGGRSQVIGLLVHDVGTSYIGEIIRGIDAELASAQYDLLLYTTHRRKIKESAHVVTLTRGMADGLLLVLPRDPGSYLETLRQHRFPHVLIDHRGGDEEAPAVAAANWQGAYKATEYLIELRHRRIGFITGAMDQICAQDRLAGYKTALADHGITFDPELVSEGDFFQPLGYVGASVLLELPHPPTAIFASNDVSAFGVMEAVREYGLRIPNDVSILGFDDIPQAAHVHPPLTTVRQPLEEMGRTATRMLLEYIKDPLRPLKRVELPTELVLRQSCCPEKSQKGGVI